MQYNQIKSLGCGARLPVWICILLLLLIMDHWIIYLMPLSMSSSIKWVKPGIVRTKEATAYKAFRLVTNTHKKCSVEISCCVVVTALTATTTCAVRLPISQLQR